MTIFVPAGGKRILKQEIVTTSTAVVLEEPEGRVFVYTVESVAVRLKGTDTSFDFSIDDGTSDISFAGADTFGSETYWLVTDLHVEFTGGKKLKFKAGGSTLMHVTAVLLQSEANTGRQ